MSAALIFKSKFGIRNLKKTYKEKISSKSTVGRDRITRDKFNSILSDEIHLINSKILSGTYKFTSYKQLLISKGASKNPRILSVPTQRDRLTLRCLCDFLFELYPDQKTQIPQTKIKEIQQAVASGIYTHFVKIDVKDFYPSIDHSILLKRLSKNIKKPEIISLISGAIRNQTLSDRQSQKNAEPNSLGIPQGLSISNVLAEIYLSDFDALFKSKTELKYFRYVDDILILCDLTALNSAKSAVQELEQLKLNAHDFETIGSKSNFGKLFEGFDFLGYEFKGNKTSPRESSIKNFEASLVKEFTTYQYSKNKFSAPKHRKKSDKVKVESENDGLKLNIQKT